MTVSELIAQLAILEGTKNIYILNEANMDASALEYPDFMLGEKGEAYVIVAAKRMTKEEYALEQQSLSSPK